ncbi:MAG: cysteine-rich CWC family protein [Pyrinomonadaceae bacterium]|nr:cysteine-rich CWC family protein [Pyrinomonadaceae bacterium]
MSLQESNQISAPIACGVERCEACGSEFTCGARLKGCWCSEIKLNDAVRAGLRERYEHCLCRACLEQFAEKESKQG